MRDAEAAEDIETPFHVFDRFKCGMKAITQRVRLQELSACRRSEEQSGRPVAHELLKDFRRPRAEINLAFGVRSSTSSWTRISERSWRTARIGSSLRKPVMFCQSRE